MLQVLLLCIQLWRSVVSVEISQGVTQFEKRCTSEENRQYHTHCDYEPSTQILWCDNTNFAKVPPQPSNAACENSTVMYLNQSCIQKIKKGDFHQFPNLVRIDCSSNKLDFVDFNNFNLSRLKRLYLGHNGIEHICLKGSDVPKLTHLSLKNNKLRSFENHVLKSLKGLNLDSNSLESLEANFCRHCKDLQQLSIRENKISTIHPDSFRDMQNLEILRLDGNKLKTLEIFPIVTLKVLSISYNKLLKIPASITDDLTGLETLNLGNNLIDEISMFNLSNLQNLSLYNNSLKTMGADIFAANNSFVYINLEHNVLENIHRDAFKSLCHLEVLLLENNSLKTPNENWFKHVVNNNVKAANVKPLADGNKWRCDNEILEYYEFLGTIKDQGRWLETLRITCHDKRFKQRPLDKEIYNIIKKEQKTILTTTVIPTALPVPEDNPVTTNCTTRTFTKRIFTIKTQYKPPLPLKHVMETTSPSNHRTTVPPNLTKSDIDLSWIMFIVVAVVVLILVVIIRIMVYKQKSIEKSTTKLKPNNKDDEIKITEAAQGTEECVTSQTIVNIDNEVDTEHQQQIVNIAHFYDSVDDGRQRRGDPVGCSEFGSQTIPKSISTSND